MSTAPRNPQNSGDDRPLPPEVYQRRRIAAAVALIVVIALLWWLISSLGGSNDSADDQAAETVVTSTAPEKTAPPKPAEDEKAGEKKPERGRVDKATCEVADLRVEAIPASPSFGGDELPKFFAKVFNPTKGACEIDVEEEPLLFEVFTLNNYQRVWGDLDCNNSSLSGTIKIGAGESQNYEMGAWSKTTSAPGKCDDRQPVGPGSYLLYAHLGSNVSEPATFNLN